MVVLDITNRIVSIKISALGCRSGSSGNISCFKHLQD